MEDPLQNQHITTQKYDALFNINMIHISPPQTCEGLFALVAPHTVQSNGFVYMYGPYKRNGEHTSSSNVNFDEFAITKSTMGRP